MIRGQNRYQRIAPQKMGLYIGDGWQSDKTAINGSVANAALNLIVALHID